LFAFFGPGEPFLDVQQAAWLAALDTVVLLARGQADAAAEECVDALALGRDVSFPSVMGRMFGAGIIHISTNACARALSGASAATVARVRAQLFAIRRGTPRFADILRRESLFQQLWIADSGSDLPEGARVFIAGRRNQRSSAFESLEMALFGASAFDGLAARMAAFLDAQRLEWPACADRMEQVIRRFEWNPIVGRSSAFISLLRRHRNAILELDAVACAASIALEQARTGVPPRETGSTCRSDRAVGDVRRGRRPNARRRRRTDIAPERHVERRLGVVGSARSADAGERYRPPLNVTWRRPWRCL
jgi:hypothetical protein